MADSFTTDLASLAAPTQRVLVLPALHAAPRRAAAVTLARFRDGRDTLVNLLLNLQPADWQRPAVHETQGPTTQALQAHNIANHDADHLEQLIVAVRAWEQRRHA